jgi:hypothetical protein
MAAILLPGEEAMESRFRLALETVI